MRGNSVKITNDTMTWQVAELMGDQADETDGRILLGLLSLGCVVNTDDLPNDQWEAMLGRAQAIRRAMNEDDEPNPL